jgi:competence ComEA-like helix-hairpin-helix protein
VWFVGQVTHYVGRLDPGSGEFTRHDLPAGAGPHNVIVGPEGDLWYAGNTAAHIGRMDPATGEITRFAMPGGARDPHTLIFGPTGHLWFTVQGDNRVGRLDTSTGEVDLIEVPTARARPYGIVIAPDGTPWVAAFGTNKLLSVDPTTLKLREHVLPSAEVPVALKALGVLAGILVLAAIGASSIARGSGVGPSAPSASRPPRLATAGVTPFSEPGDAGASSAPSDGGAADAAPSQGLTADGKVVLNRASVEELRRIPGVGPKRAQAIVDLRTKLGGRFKRLTDLLRVKGIGPKSLKKMEVHLVLDAKAD